MRKPKVKSGRGGYRKHAKRPLKYGEKTTTIGPYRVPESKAEELDGKMKKELKKLEEKATKERQAKGK